MYNGNQITVNDSQELIAYQNDKLVYDSQEVSMKNE